jgi:hypothetical protein
LRRVYGEFGRVSLEFPLTGFRAEVVGSAIVYGRACCVRQIHRHRADGIGARFRRDEHIGHWIRRSRGGSFINGLHLVFPLYRLSPEKKSAIHWHVAVSLHERCGASPVPSQTKKADVAEHPAVFDHVGLLVNEPSSYAGMLFI